MALNINMDEFDLTNFTPQQLLQCRQDNLTLIDQAKKVIEAVDAETSRRYADFVKQGFEREQKEDGKVTSKFDDFIVVGNVSKTVAWDQGKLREIAFGMPSWDEVEAVFKVKWDVSERTYAKLPTNNLRAQLDAARTVKRGDLKVHLEAKS